jgi:hypothetical protein
MRYGELSRWQTANAFTLCYRGQLSFQASPSRGLSDALRLSGQFLQKVPLGSIS